MTKRDRHIWVDLTNIWTWTGSYTGMQRTVYNLAKGFHTDTRVKFFYFDPSRKTYQECQFGAEVTQSESATANPSHKENLRKLFAKLPSPVKNTIKKAHARLNARSSEEGQSFMAPFKDHDTVVVVGGNWGDDYAGFIDGFKALKAERSLNFIHVVYDLIPIKFPNFFAPGSTKSYENYLNTLITFADQLVCISRSTKRDLDEYIERHRAPEAPSTSYIRLGEDMVSQNIKPIIRQEYKRRISNPFIICVGTIEARKNHALLYYVVKEALREKSETPQIVIAGRRSWMTTEIQHMIDSDPEVKDKLIIIDDASDIEIAWLYQNCIFAIYPSMYEGWGLPLAEAAHYGKLCLSSNTSSMPEVLGAFGVYFSPFNTQECLAAILRYTHDKSLLRSKEAALKKLRPWTWADAHADFIKATDLYQMSEKKKTYEHGS